MKISGRQLAIMRVLWDCGEATVADVQERLEVDLAYSTIATVIGRLEKRGLVTHRADGRVYYYRPTVSENGAGSSMVGELVDRIFGGSPAQLVSHLLESQQVDAGELEEIKKLVQQHARRRNRSSGNRP